MELNDIIQLGAKTFKGKLDLNGDGKVDINEASEALKTLLSNNQGQFDLAAVVDKMRSSGLADLASSWLSDGKNDPVTPGQIKQIIEPEKFIEPGSWSQSGSRSRCLRRLTSGPTIRLRIG